MKPDLLFHVVSRRKWPSLNQGGYYRPESDKQTEPEDIRVECVGGEDLKNYLDRNYKGRKNLLILVIDVSRLAHRVEKMSDSGHFLVHQRINVDSILDKVQIDCNTEGGFDLDIRQD